MKIADLYCGAGGSAMGIHQAIPDAEIVGFDVEKQRHYPFKFVQADALAVDLSDFDFVWASPPCQHYSKEAGQAGTRRGHRALLKKTRERLMESGKPFVMENIFTARWAMQWPVKLCGTQFGLGVFRHRSFECSFPVEEPWHEPHRGRVGDGRFVTVTGQTGGSSKRDGWKNGTVADWKRAMGIDWMNSRELAEAIPPAYAKFLVGQWLVPERLF